jgi:hypothetical protein
MSRQSRTRGGSSETEAKAFAVKPAGVPSAARVVTTVTPVANWAQARRKSALPKSGAASACAALRWSG